MTWFALPVQGDAAGDKRRAQFATVKRLIVVPPFFGTDTLRNGKEADKVEPGKRAATANDGSKNEESKTEEATNQTPLNDGNADAHTEGDERRRTRGKEKNEISEAVRKTQYFAQLRKLEDHAQARLPERVAVRTSFEVVGKEEMQTAFKELGLTPATLFQNKGLIKGAKFASPDAEAVKRLCARLHADAVLLMTLDEPHRSGARYTFDPLSGVGYDSAHARGKAAFYVLLSDGTEALHDFTEVLHPLTRIGNREFTLVDWMEAEDQVIENFMDEWTRYTPAK